MKADELFEMSNIAREDSGLPVRIWVSSGGSAHHRHGPRIKVELAKGSAWIPVLLKREITMDDVVGYEKLPANVLSDLREFIDLNYDTLVAYWNDEISTKQMILRIEPI